MDSVGGSESLVMTAIRAPNGRMQRYVPDPHAPHVVLQEDGRPAMKFADEWEAITVAAHAQADCIIRGVLVRFVERAA